MILFQIQDCKIMVLTLNINYTLLLVFHEIFIQQIVQ